MYIQIDYDSEEAIYRQLCRQIIFEIAARRLQDGDSLPSVRDLACEIGINMHTVNKAYTVLREEGYLVMDKRRGTQVCVKRDDPGAEESLKDELSVIIAKAGCRGVDIERIHRMIDEISEEYTTENE